MFKFKGKIYVTMVLPFGSAVAASIYIRFMNLFQAFWSKHGIISITYIDDILIIAVSKSQIHSAFNFIRDVLKFCGVKIEEGKSMNHGAQRVSFIGTVIDTASWIILINEETVAKTQTTIDTLRTKRGDYLLLIESLSDRCIFISQASHTTATTNLQLLLRLD